MSIPRRRARAQYALPFALLACDDPTEVQAPVAPSMRLASSFEVAEGVTITDPALPTGAAFGINDAGVISGLVSREGDVPAGAFIWSEEDGLTVLDSDFLGNALAISNSGIVGGVMQKDHGPTAFRWTSETGTTFLSEEVGFGQVTTVNDDGLAGGTLVVDGLGRQAVLWSPNGDVELLGSVGFNVSFQHTIFVNDHGDVAFAADGALRVRWHDTGVEEIIPGFMLSGLNDQGQILYQADGAGFIRERDGSVTPLPSGGFMFPVALNDLGHAVGRIDGELSYLIPGCEPILLPGHVPGAFAIARAINNTGQVTGDSSDRDGQHIVIWTVDAELACRRRPVIAALADASLILGESYHAEGGFTDEDEGETWSGVVDYGAGAGPQALPLDGTSFELAYTYAAPGSYTVAVTVTDSRDATGSAEATVEVVTVEAAVARLGTALLEIGGSDELPDWARGLLAKVERAADHLGRDNAAAAAGALSAFVRELEAHVRAGRVAETEAGPLLEYAGRILALVDGQGV